MLRPRPCFDPSIRLGASAATAAFARSAPETAHRGRSIRIDLALHSSDQAIQQRPPGYPEDRPATWRSSGWWRRDGEASVRRLRAELMYQNSAQALHRNIRTAACTGLSYPPASGVAPLELGRWTIVAVEQHENTYAGRISQVRFESRRQWASITAAAADCLWFITSCSSSCRRTQASVGTAPPGAGTGRTSGFRSL